MDPKAPLPANTPAAPDDAQPEKYIRTFAGDMETFKEGGSPDLAPFEKKPEPTAEERLVAPSPVPPPKPPRVPEPPQSAAPAPPPRPVPEAGPTPIETYASDFLNRVEETHASPVTVLAAEQDAARAAPAPEPPKPRSNTVWYIIGGVVLILIGAASAYVAHLYYAQTNAPVVVASAPSAPIFVDESQAVSGTGAALMQAIAKSVGTLIKSGSIRLLYTASSTDSGSVFSALDASAPNVLIRNINPAGSMAGVVDVNGVQSPFFILSVSSYSDTFSGMLTWEPFMRRDLITLFPPYPVTVASTATATSTAPAPAPAPLSFTDATVANHDVRVYSDSQGRDIVLYGYWNQNTLVIARDAAAFTEILGRLATSRTQ